MWEKDDRTAEGIPDTAKWERWLLRLSENMGEMLQLTALSVLEGLRGRTVSASFRPVPVNGLLTERIAAGGDVALPFSVGGERSLLPEEGAAMSFRGQGHTGRRNSRTPYETARELQRQSELLLRT